MLPTAVAMKYHPHHRLAGIHGEAWSCKHHARPSPRPRVLLQRVFVPLLMTSLSPLALPQKLRSFHAVSLSYCAASIAGQMGRVRAIPGRRSAMSNLDTLAEINPAVYYIYFCLRCEPGLLGVRLSCPSPPPALPKRSEVSALTAKNVAQQCLTQRC